MNRDHFESTSPPRSGGDARDAFLVAALSEQARLGPRSHDEDLVHRILLSTVQKSPPVAAALDLPPDRRLWLTGTALVAALVALLFSVLSLLPFGSSGRTSNEVRLLVNYPAPDADAFESARPRPGPAPLSPVLASPYDGTLEIAVTPRHPNTGGLDRFTPEASHSPSPSLAPSVTGFPDRAFVADQFRIDADEMTRSDDELVYRGNVVLLHENFTLEADLIRLEASSGPTSAPGRGSSAICLAENAVLRFSASNATSVLEVRAEKLELDSIEGKMLFSGVSHLETVDNGTLAVAVGQQVRVTPSGYAIETRSKSAVPAMIHATPTPERR